jgi:Arc/MetJ family transcription regulator
MRTTLDLDEALMQKALAETGAKTKTEVVERGLQALVDRAARQRLKALFGRVGDVAKVPRRRS